MREAFKEFHPIVNFYYFVAVIVFSMFFMHPVFLIISLISSFAYSVVLKGHKAVRFNLIYLMPLLIIMAVLNPMFNHAGVTILSYFRDGNPLTLESIVYGIASSTMYVSVILWFTCYNEIMTSDKFIYLWGRIIPKGSLLISMTLRFIPRYKAQIKVISNGQKAIGRDITNGNILKRALNGIKILSIMVTWALENAIETADSMRARGYGLKERTSFSLYRFDKRDRNVLIIMFVCTVLIMIGSFFGETDIAYIPAIKLKQLSFMGIMSYLSYSLLCLIPIIEGIKEERVWKSLRSAA